MRTTSRFSGHRTISKHKCGLRLRGAGYFGALRTWEYLEILLDCALSNGHAPNTCVPVRCRRRVRSRPAAIRIGFRGLYDEGDHQALYQEQEDPRQSRPDADAPARWNRRAPSQSDQSDEPGPDAARYASSPAHFDTETGAKSGQAHGSDESDTHQAAGAVRFTSLPQA